MTPPPPRRLLKTAQAAEYLGLNAQTLENWRYLSKVNGPPFLRIDGRIRYDLRDLDAWIEAQKRTPAA